MSRLFHDELDATLTEMFEFFDVPSAVAVAVHGDETFVKPYGEKRIGEGSPIGADTAFIIASCSKSFCGALAATLVDDGIVDWDEKVVDTVDAFVLSDPWITKNLTLRDLLGMRTGLKREGVCEYGFNADGECADYFQYMRHVGFEAGFRETFTYSNAGYAAAATLLSRKAGKGYGDLLQERIFDPAGMGHAVSRRGRLGAHPDHFHPHVRMHNDVIAAPEPVSVGWEGSTAVYLSANDTASWLRLQLGNGEIGGRRIISEKSIAETRRPNSIDMPGKLTGERFSLYSMGWQPFDYHGRLFYRHTGSEFGSSTFTLFCPEENLGVACYVGIYSSAATACGYAVVDALLDFPARDLIKPYAVMLQERVNDAVADVKTRFPEDPQKAQRTKIKGADGRYVSPIYGDAFIALDGGRLRLSFDERPMLNAELIPVGDGVFDIKHDHILMEQELFGEFMRLRMQRSLRGVETFEHSLFGLFERKRGR